MTTTLTIYNGSVKLETNDYNLTRRLDSFLESFYTSKQKAFNSKDTEPKRFFGKINSRPIYFMHETQFVHFYQHCKERGYTVTVDEKIYSRDYEEQEADYEVREPWAPRENQVPVIEFLLNEPTGSKLVPLTMGSGKGPIALFTLAKLKKRVGLVILSFLIEKWVNEIASVHKCSTKDVMVVQGSRMLAGLISMAKEGHVVNNYIIFSHRTMQEYITAYEDDPEATVERYGCSPEELYPLLGIGVFLVDETHMAFHSLFKISIFINVRYKIGMSGTLVSDDNIVTRMHSVMYKAKDIYGDTMISRHIDVTAISYNIADKTLPHIQTSQYGSKTYSHTAFEQSITRKDFNKEKYYKIIQSVIEDYYITDYKEKDKLIIFVSLVKTATDLTCHLQDIYPDKIVNRYCEEDPYENLMESDIIVSTIMSAGTGVDIPMLRTAINTVSISSTPSNLQTVGRLRKLADRDVKFCYIYANQIPKQVEYHRKKKDIFRTVAKTITERGSRYSIH